MSVAKPMASTRTNKIQEARCTHEQSGVDVSDRSHDGTLSCVLTEHRISVRRDTLPCEIDLSVACGSAAGAMISHVYGDPQAAWGRHSHGMLLRLTRPRRVMRIGFGSAVVPEECRMIVVSCSLISTRPGCALPCA